jgi:hypothetical protein
VAVEAGIEKLSPWSLQYWRAVLSREAWDRSFSACGLLPVTEVSLAGPGGLHVSTRSPTNWTSQNSSIARKKASQNDSNTFIC